MSEINVAQALQDELAVALMEAKGLTFDDATTYVAPIVRYLQQQYGGDPLYIPQPYMLRDVGAILDERSKGTPIKVILTKHNISRATYYRLLSSAAEVGGDMLHVRQPPGKDSSAILDECAQAIDPILRKHNISRRAYIRLLGRHAY